MEISVFPSQALAMVDTRLPASVASGARPTDRAAARKVAQEFEAMFLAMTLKSMRTTVGHDQGGGGGRAEETYRSLLDQEYAGAAARSGGIGLATIIEKELLRGQEVNDGGQASERHSGSSGEGAVGGDSKGD